MDWIKVDDRLPKEPIGCILKVRRMNGDEVKAYYYKDKMGWISFYGKIPTYFWHKSTKEPIYDVTYWQFNEGDSQ